MRLARRGENVVVINIIMLVKVCSRSRGWGEDLMGCSVAFGLFDR